MNVIETTTDRVINRGDIITDFRGEKAKFLYWHTNGKVVVEFDGSEYEYYPAVFNLVCIG